MELRRIHPSSGLAHLVCLCAFILVCLVAGPDNFRAPHELLPDLQDSLLAMALMSWPAHCLQLPQCSIADFPIFYPEQGALFFTDSLLGIGLIFNLLRIFFSSHLSYNLTLLLLSCLNFYSFFLLMRFARIRYLAAFLASSAFAAMPYVFQFGAHIQLYCLFLWPLSLLFCLKLAESRSPRWLFALSAVLALTFYLSMSLAIKQFFFVCLALLLSLSFVEGGSLWYWFCSRWRNQLFGALAIGATILLPLAQQYIQVRRVHPFVRDVQDSIPYSLDILAIPGYLLSFIFPAEFLADSGLKVDDLQKYSDLEMAGITPWIVVGVVLIALCVFRTALPIWLPSARLQQLLWISTISMIISIILMFGPSLVIAGNVTDVPSLYRAFYYTVPGFQALRVPVRFILPLVINAAIAFGIVLDGMFRLLSHPQTYKKKLTAFVLVSALIMAFVVDRSPWVYYGRAKAWTLDDIPTAYEVVKANPGAPVLELPMWPPSRKTFKHFHYQMQDWNPRLSGISSFFPQSFYTLRDQMASCPGHDCFHALQLSPADIFIVRLPALNPKKLNSWRRADLRPYGFSLQPQSSRRIMVWLRDDR